MSSDFIAGFGLGAVTCSAFIIFGAMFLEIRAEMRREQWRRRRAVRRAQFAAKRGL